MATNSGSSGFGAGFVGFLLGGFIGFLLRPSALLVGQLPFATVISRGTNLTGLDRLLVPTAEKSFNIMLVGAILGVVIAVVIARMTARKA